MKTTLPLVFVGTLCATTLIGPSPAAELAYYPFDDDFSDASGNGNHLRKTVASAGITTTPGEVKFGAGAVDFDSIPSNEAHFDLQSPISFSAGDAWSVVFWARRRPGTDNRSGMIAGTLGGNDFIWIPDNPATVDGLRFRNSTAGNADYSGIADDGEYHHWAVVADGAGSLTVYRDNVSLGATVIDTAFQITSVGQAFNQTTQSMNGQIDELYIYDEAISAATVNTLFTGVPEPSSALLLGVGGLALMRRRRSTPARQGGH